MANQNTDIHEIVEILRERDRDNKGLDPVQWLESKQIDGESLADVFNKQIEDNFDALIGKLLRTQNPEYLKPILIDFMAKAFELGFTTSEIKLEELFTNESD